VKTIQFRRIVQLLSFTVFTILFFFGIPYAFQSNIISFTPVFAVMSTNNILSILITFLIIISVFGLTLLFGRVYCGWICPLGSISDFLWWTDLKKRYVLHYPKFKYYVLLFLVGLTFLGIQLFWWFEPVTRIYRGITGFTTGFPTGVMEVTFLHWAGLALFLVVPLLNIFSKRLWCKTFCPSGAGYAWLTKFSRYKLTIENEKCIRCERCIKVCPVNTIEKEMYVLNPSECVNCRLCAETCPTKAIKYSALKNDDSDKPKVAITRREFIGSVATGIAAGIVLKHIPGWNRRRSVSLRPPGVADDEDFEKKCIRCGACFQVCPTKGLHPEVGNGLTSFYIPRFIPRVGYCAYSCIKCGKSCPTGAIPNLKLVDKQNTVIGTAVIDYERCIKCLICEEMCPIPEKAVRIRAVKPMDEPYVIPDLCIGCGICENACPVEGNAAIRVIRA